MKKKWTSIIAVAAILCLMAGVALAASLVYSSRYHQAAKADALLAEVYGITGNKLSFFTRTSDGDVYDYRSLDDLAGMPGDYRVNVMTGQVEWLFDGPKGTAWDAAKLDEVLIRCQEQGGYQLVCQEATAEAERLGLHETAIAPMATPAAVMVTDESKAQVQAMAKVSLTEAEAWARMAIQEKYDLTDAQMEQLAFVEESTVYMMQEDTPVIATYFWLKQSEEEFVEKDGIYYVDVNAVDGTIEKIGYDTGLLGNG